MSDPENFLARWSRRKREAIDQARNDDAAADAENVKALGAAATEEGASDAARQPSAKSDAPAFDITSLPPIESITANTDIRAFFAPGVPAELTRAALRRAWSADPAIRDFVGLAENSWDFNNPGSIPGFGPLEMTSELQRELARIVGQPLPEGEGPSMSEPATAPKRLPESASASQSAGGTSEFPSSPIEDGRRSDEFAGLSPVEFSMQPVESVPGTPATQRSKDDAASQQKSSRDVGPQSSGRRGHGGALPK
jgi:hypothetical protein